MPLIVFHKVWPLKLKISEKWYQDESLEHLHQIFFFLNLMVPIPIQSSAFSFWEWVMRAKITSWMHSMHSPSKNVGLDPLIYCSWGSWASSTQQYSQLVFQIKLYYSNYIFFYKWQLSFIKQYDVISQIIFIYDI